MEALLVITVCFVIGVILRRFNLTPENTASVLAGFIIYVSLPALVLQHVPALEWKPALLFSISMPHVILGIAFLFFSLLGRFFQWSTGTITCLTLTAGLGNTSFVGLPMIHAYFGEDQLATGIMIDQAGGFLALTTWGFVILHWKERGTPAVASYTPGTSESGANKQDLTRLSAEVVVSAKSTVPGNAFGQVRFIIKKLVGFPPFLALILALFLPSQMPSLVRDSLSILGGTLTPIALVAVGYQLQWRDTEGRSRALGLGLVFRLILSPLLVGLAVLWWEPGAMNWTGMLPADGADIERAFQDMEVLRVTIFEAAMPPMITAGILCMEANKDPRLASLLLGIGIPISFLTLPLVYMAMTGNLPPFLN